jgi:hypothetical protein
MVAGGEQGLAPEITRFQVLDNSLNSIGSGTHHFSEAHIISIDVLVLGKFDRPLGCEIGEAHLGLKQPRASSGAHGVGSDTRPCSVPKLCLQL